MSYTRKVITVREAGEVLDLAEKTMKRATEEKYSMKAAAALIGVHVATVSRLMDSGKLGYYQIGARRVVGQTHLEHFLSVAERKPTVRLVS